MDVAVIFNNDDIITIEESNWGKILSAIFVVFMLYFLTQALGMWSATSISNYEMFRAVEKFVLGTLLVFALISMFFKMYKLEKRTTNIY